MTRNHETREYGQEMTLEPGEMSGLDETWMNAALLLAGRAVEEDEVPIGAVIVSEGKIVGRGWNRNIGLHDPSAHAEIMAMRDAGTTLGNHRLTDCTLYVTLEPCMMCAGAMIHARLERIVFGASDPKTGAAGGKFDLLSNSAHNHAPVVVGGCLADECSVLIKDFFRQRRRSGSTA